MNRVLVVTEDNFLFRKISLILAGEYLIERVSVRDLKRVGNFKSAILYDIDSYPLQLLSELGILSDRDVEGILSDEFDSPLNTSVAEERNGAEAGAYSLSPSRIITVGRYEGRLLRPFSEERLKGAVEIAGGNLSVPTLTLGERCAYIRDKKISLTEVEFNLLNCLVSKGGEFVTREQILSTVWGEGVDGGVVNVYVHYLREKLEFFGEKIIISSRKSGYKIREDYLRGGGT